MADVASNLYSWSTTASSNSPSDATTIGAGLADNFQEIQKVVRQDLASKGADIASATTTDIGAVAGKQHDITGTTTITSFGTVAAGIEKVLQFDGALTLTHSGNLILPGAVNILTVAGDVGVFVSEGSGVWRCISFAGKNHAGTNGVFSGTLAVTGVATLTAQPILSSLTASLPVFSDGSKGLVSNAMTGTGSVMMSASPTTTGTLTAAAINASGTVAMAGAATVGGTTTGTGFIRSLATSNTVGTPTFYLSSSVIREGADASFNVDTFDGAAYQNRLKIVGATGNVGIGVTPSAWSQGKAIEAGSVGAAFYGFNSTTSYLSSNWYYNAGDKFAGTGYATLYIQNAGAHYWQSSTASGTAGNAATMTTLMSVTNAGAVTIPGTTTIGAASAGVGALTINHATQPTIYLAKTNATATTWQIYNNGNLVFYDGTNTPLYFVGADSTFGGLITATTAGINVPSSGTAGNTYSGTYTPTLTNTTNVGASTAYLATYMRVGNTVTVAGQIDLDPTAAGATELGISLPVASAFTTTLEMGGTAAALGVTEVFALSADATNDRAKMSGLAVSTANHQVAYHFTYQVK